MSKNNFSRIFSSSLGMVIGFAISGVIGLLTRIILGRILQPEKYGMLSEGLAVLNFFVILSLLGTSEGITRFKSFGDRFYNTISSSLVICFPLSIISSILVFISSGFLAGLTGNPNLEPVFKVFSLNIPATVLLAIFIAVFRGNKKTKERVLVSDLLVPAAILIFSLISILLITELPEVAAIGYVAASWIGALIAGYIVLFNGNRIDFPRLEDIKSLLDFSSPLMASSLFSFGFTWLNILLLGYLLGSESAGFYNAAYPLTFAMAAILTSVNYLFLPVATSVYSKNNLEELKSLYHTVCRWLLITSLPMLAVFALKPEFLITTLFGSGFTPAATLLFILAVARFTDIFFGPVGQTLVAVGKTREELFSKGTGFGFLLVSSVYLINQLGLIGAGVGYLIGISLTNILRLYFARKVIHFNPFNKDVIKPLFAFIAPLPVLLFVSGDLIIEFISIIAYGLFYSFLIAVARPVKEEDLKVLEGMEFDNSQIEKSVIYLREVLEKWFKE